MNSRLGSIFPFTSGAAIDDHIAEIAEDFRRPIALGAEAEKLRRVVDKRRRRLAFDETSDAGSDFPGTGMLVFTPRTRNSLSERSMRWTASSNVWPDAVSFHQQRIEIGRNDRAAESGAAVEANAESRCRAVGRQSPIIRNEMILRIFGGDAALDRIAARLDLVLRWDIHRRLVQLVPLGDENLALDDVDTR